MRKPVGLSAKLWSSWPIVAFGIGSQDGKGASVGLVGTGVGTDDGIGLGSVGGLAERGEVGSVVVGSLIALRDTNIVCLCDEPVENVSPRLGILVLSQSVRFGVDILNWDASGIGVVISFEGLGIEGEERVGTIGGQGDGRGEGGGDGFGAVGCLVGAIVSGDKGVEYGNGDSIFNGFGFGTGLFVGVGVGIGG